MIEFEKYILKNGLKVISYYNKDSYLSTVNILYDVGSRDEDEEHTGYAHLFEHLMFGGSKKVSKFDSILQSAGGESNAYTNNDITNYYLTIPSQNIETAFFIEADRMLELSFSEKKLEIQRNVVCEEFRQRYLNQPYGDVSLLLKPLAYKTHPYKWNTIGKSISHIENATLAEVKDFYYKYYAPNNAIMVVAGNIKANTVFRLAEKYFSQIPKRNIPIRNIPIEKQQNEYREKIVEKNVPNDAIFMAWHCDERLSKNYYATDIISDILSNGKSSPFYINLVKDKKLFSEIDAYISGSYHPGLFQISGFLMPNVSYENAISEIEKEINKICLGNFSDKTLEKVKNKFISNQKFNLIYNSDIANDLAYYEWLGDANIINLIADDYCSTTKKDIINVANNIFSKKNLSCLKYNKNTI